jgi:hypothetical protein
MFAFQTKGCVPLDSRLFVALHGHEPEMGLTDIFVRPLSTQEKK